MGSSATDPKWLFQVQSRGQASTLSRVLQAPSHRELAIEMILNTWHHHPVPINTSIKKQSSLQDNATRAAVGTH